MQKTHTCQKVVSVIHLQQITVLCPEMQRTPQNKKSASMWFFYTWAIPSLVCQPTAVNNCSTTFSWHTHAQMEIHHRHDRWSEPVRDGSNVRSKASSYLINFSWAAKLSPVNPVLIISQTSLCNKKLFIFFMRSTMIINLFQLC